MLVTHVIPVLETKKFASGQDADAWLRTRYRRPVGTDITAASVYKSTIWWDHILLLGYEDKTHVEPLVVSFLFLNVCHTTGKSKGVWSTVGVKEFEIWQLNNPDEIETLDDLPAAMINTARWLRTTMIKEKKGTWHRQYDDVDPDNVPWVAGDSRPVHLKLYKGITPATFLLWPRTVVAFLRQVDVPDVY